MLSLRRINPRAAWCSNYEFENVITGIDGVDRFCPEPGFAYRERLKLLKGLLYRGLPRQFARINPGIRPLKVQKEYDLFVFVCMNPQDLLYLSALKDWRDACKVKVCFMVELWNSWIPQFQAQLELLRDFDHVCLCFGGSVPGLQQFLGRPCQHVPLAADVLRFTPYPNPPRRMIDVYSMGRRVEGAHQTLLAKARSGQIFYIYDTIPGDLVRPADVDQHRDLVASLVKRARAFVSYPALVGVTQDTQGQSEVGARFYEGAAGGAVMVGQAPSNPAFQRDFGWNNAVLELGSGEDDVARVLKWLDSKPEEVAALQRRNATEALLRFDWLYRWQQILRLAGLPQTPAMAMRAARLKELAAAATN